MMFVLAMEFSRGLERRLCGARPLTTDFGGHSGGVTPVPIPNTEVKPTSADGTWGETPWESRTPPDFSVEGPTSVGPFSRFPPRSRGPCGSSTPARSCHVPPRTRPVRRTPRGGRPRRLGRSQRARPARRAVSEARWSSGRGRPGGDRPGRRRVGGGAPARRAGRRSGAPGPRGGRRSAAPGPGRGRVGSIRAGGRAAGSRRLRGARAERSGRRPDSRPVRRRGDRPARRRRVRGDVGRRPVRPSGAGRERGARSGPERSGPARRGGAGRGGRRRARRRRSGPRGDDAGRARAPAAAPSDRRSRGAHEPGRRGPTRRRAPPARRAPGAAPWTRPGRRGRGRPRPSPARAGETRDLDRGRPPRPGQRAGPSGATPAPPEAWEPEEWIDVDELEAAGADAVARGRSRRRAPSEPAHPCDHVEDRSGPSWRGPSAPAAVERVEQRLKDASRAFEAERYRDAARILKKLADDAPTAPAVRELYGLTLYRPGSGAPRPASSRPSASSPARPSSTRCWPTATGRCASTPRSTSSGTSCGAASPGAELVTEGRIVAAGALADQGDAAGAVRLLEQGFTFPKRPREHHLRRAYALADAYERAGDVRAGPRAVRAHRARSIPTSPTSASALRNAALSAATGRPVAAVTPSSPRATVTTAGDRHRRRRGAAPCPVRLSPRATRSPSRPPSEVRPRQRPPIRTRRGRSARSSSPRRGAPEARRERRADAGTLSRNPESGELAALGRSCSGLRRSDPVGADVRGPSPCPVVWFDPPARRPPLWSRATRSSWSGGSAAASSGPAAPPRAAPRSSPPRSCPVRAPARVRAALAPVRALLAG